MINMLDTYIPGWPAIKKIGNNAAAKKLLLWVFIVPIIAKIFLQIPELSFEIGEHSYTVALNLPFNWKLLFFSGLFIGQGGALYNIWCPTVISLYSDYVAFKEAGKGSRNIVGLFQITSANEKHYKHLVSKTDLTASFINDYIKSITPEQDLNEEALNTILSNAEIQENKQSEAFWYVWHFSERHKPFKRFIIVLSLGIGFGLAAWIVVQNIYYVLIA